MDIPDLIHFPEMPTRLLPMLSELPIHVWMRTTSMQVQEAIPIPLRFIDSGSMLWRDGGDALNDAHGGGVI